MINNLKNEKWKDIDGFNGAYQVSSMGRVKALPTEYYNPNGRKCVRKERILKQHINKRGYCRVCLYNVGAGTKKHLMVHVLVAKTFIENTNSDFDMVNHINGNKEDNRVENLEWTNNKLNVLHSYRDENMVHKNSKAVIQFDSNMNEVGRFKTIRQAQEETGFERKYISEAINKYKGFYWVEWKRTKEEL